MLPGALGTPTPHTKSRHAGRTHGGLLGEPCGNSSPRRGESPSCLKSSPLKGSLKLPALPTGRVFIARLLAGHLGVPSGTFLNAWEAGLPRAARGLPFRAAEGLSHTRAKGFLVRQCPSGPALFASSRVTDSACSVGQLCSRRLTPPRPSLDVLTLGQAIVPMIVVERARGVGWGDVSVALPPPRSPQFIIQEWGPHPTNQKPGLADFSLPDMPCCVDGGWQ